MRMRGALIAIGLFSGLAATAGAGILNITPTRLAVSPNGEVVAFNLRNAGDEKALVEVEVFAWTDVHNPKALEPTQDLLIVPPIVELPANETQVLRLAPRLKADLAEEKMYRLIITELPSEIGQETGVGFAVEMSLPIFIAPEGANADPVWSLGWQDVATPELSIVNRGNAHLRVRSFELFADPKGNALFQSDDSAYILAGEEKRWPLKGDFSAIKGPITVKAETTKGPIDALILLPEG